MVRGCQREAEKDRIQNALCEAGRMGQIQADELSAVGRGVS